MRRVLAIERQLDRLELALIGDEREAIDRDGGVYGRELDVPGPRGTTLRLFIRGELGSSNSAVHSATDQNNKVYAVKFFRYKDKDDEERKDIIERAKIELQIGRLVDERLGRNEFCGRYGLCASTFLQLKHTFILVTPSPGTLSYPDYCLEMARVETKGIAHRLRIAKLASDLLKGIAILHDAGIVHRDLKPSNVVVQLGELMPGDSLTVKMDSLRIIDYDFAQAEERFSSKLPESMEPTRPYDRGMYFSDPVMLDVYRMESRYMTDEQVFHYLKHEDVYMAATVITYPLRTRFLIDRQEGTFDDDLDNELLFRPIMPPKPKGEFLRADQWTGLIESTKPSSESAALEQVRPVLEEDWSPTLGGLDETEQQMAYFGADPDSAFDWLLKIVHGMTTPVLPARLSSADAAERCDRELKREFFGWKERPTVRDLTMPRGNKRRRVE